MRTRSGSARLLGFAVHLRLDLLTSLRRHESWTSSTKPIPMQEPMPSDAAKVHGAACPSGFSPRSAGGHQWRADYCLLNHESHRAQRPVPPFACLPKFAPEPVGADQQTIVDQPSPAVANQRLLASDLAEPFAEPDAPPAAAPNQWQTDGGSSSNGEGTSR